MGESLRCQNAEAAGVSERVNHTATNQTTVHFRNLINLRIQI